MNTKHEDARTQQRDSSLLPNTFLGQAREKLDRIANYLCALEVTPRAGDLLETVKREAQYVDGAASTRGLHDVAALAHGLEEMVEKDLTPAAVSAGLKVIAAVQEAIEKDAGGRDASIPNARELLGDMGVSVERLERDRAAGHGLEL